MLSELIRAGFFAVAAAYSLLLIQLWLFRRRQQRQFQSLAWAITAMLVWALFQAQSHNLPVTFAADILLLTSWLGLLMLLPQATRALLPLLNQPLYIPLLPTGLALLGLTFASYSASVRLSSALILLLDIVTLSLLTHRLRYAREGSRPALRYLTLAMGSVLILQSLGQLELLLRHLSGPVSEQITIAPEFQASLPFLMLLVLPLWMLFIAKSHQVVPRAMVSHRAAFVAGVALLSGLFVISSLLIFAWISTLEIQWQFQAQVAFFLLLVPLLGALLLSPGLRHRLSVFIHKSFITNKYDYRRAWIDLSEHLSQSQHQDPQRTSLQALMSLMDCDQGGLWQVLAGKELEPTVAAGLRLGSHNHAGTLVRFLQSTGWVVDLREWQGDPGLYPGFSLPESMQAPLPWLLVPIFDNSSAKERHLLAIAVLNDSAPPRFTDWEDHDLLKTAASQIGNYLALQQTVDQLSQARQFEAFNRMSAFVVHDLKNTLLQLELINRNASRFKQNPEFIDDTLATLSNATTRMQRLLAQLRQKPHLSQGPAHCESGNSLTSARAHPEPSPRRPVLLNTLLQKVSDERQSISPAPQLLLGETILWLSSDHDRLLAVLLHLVENAQQACKSDGKVWISARRKQEEIIVEIGDNGCGMSEEFIRTRLFRPFETTRQNAGMGIGVFEAKQFMTEMDGWIKVRSQPGLGTTFSLHFPGGSQAKEPYLSQSTAGILNAEETP